MTKMMQFTPPSNSKTHSARDIALRGNMGSANFQQRGTGKAGLTRTETIRNVRAARPDVIKAYRPRVARTSKVPSISGFHVHGLGNLPQLTLGELKTKLGVAGFTAIKFGGLPVRSLFV